MKCPRCAAENTEAARFCANCGQPLAAQAAPLTALFAPAAVPDPNTAFVLEFVLGIFGFLGVGWLYGGRTVLGLVMLVGWWLFVASGISGSLLSGGFGCCLWLPVHFIAPLISALVVKNELERNPFG
ncbi:MAG: zinc ribbon domain-containing protein [Chloroflexi bacterium]|nr:zinc ribbon domain-containing protein [Chloroflexota bacterium]